MDINEYDTIIKAMAAIMTHQDTLNQAQATTNRRLEETASDMRAFVQQQMVINAGQVVVNTQNTTLIMRIVRTLDRIDEKLEQLLVPRP